MAIDRGEQIEFSALGKLLQLTDGNLGAHLQKLEEADYIRVKKIRGPQAANVFEGHHA